MKRLITPVLLALSLLTLPQVTSAIAVTAVAPAAGAAGVCVDTPLQITFGQTPKAGTSGTIRVFQADGSLFDTVTLGSTSQRAIGGATFNSAPYLYNYYPVIVSGNTVGIYLHQALAYNQVYYVTIDPGAITDAQGNAFPGFTDANTWRFTTKAAPPAIGTATVTVAADGTGDFATVQGAIDFVPISNTRPFQINVRPGVYTEIDYIRSSKPFITISGQDRTQTIIQYANNNNLNSTSSTFRCVFCADAGDFTLQNMTIHNTTPVGGSQAEALRASKTHVLLDYDNFLSYQDTLLLSGTDLVASCYIEGDVDFMWGSGANFFQNCQINTVHGGYYTQIRNSQGKNGNVYVHCNLTRTSSLADATAYLGRIDPTVYPYSQVVYINCAMDKHIKPVGWLLNNATVAPTVQFWEYGSTDLSGKPLDVSGRASFSQQLAASTAAQWSDPAFVLGGWVPTVPSAAVSGAASLQNWTGAAQSLTFTLTPIGSTTGTALTQILTPAVDGSFTLTGIPLGTYTLGIKGSKWLRKDAVVGTVNGNITGLAVSLLAGDLNGDNQVSLSDLAILRAAYGSTSTSANWNANADLNGDGQVSLSDLAMLRANYGKIGDP